MIEFHNLDDGECCNSPIEIFDGDPLQILISYGANAQSVLTDVGTMAEPVTITTAIAAPLYPRQRSWLTAASAITPTLPDSTVGPQILEWYLAWASNSNPITLDSTDGLLLSGPWTGGAGSILYLQADGAGGWIEGGRNEI